MKRILIIRSGAVGDLILTLPVLSALKKSFDGLAIDMMGNPGRLSLLKQCGYVENVLSIDDRRFTPLFATGGSPTGSVLDRLRSYDAILSYLPDPDGLFADNLRRFASGPVLTGRSRPEGGCRIHMTRVLIEAVKPLGVDATVHPPEIPLSLSGAADDTGNLPLDETLIALHPGSGGLDKCWRAERYAALIGWLVDRGLSPIVTFGPADDTVRGRILSSISARDVHILEDLPLLDMAALYARCQVMIGNDSGMTHLAAASGTPVIALFGPTDPAVWGPKGKEVRLVWGSEVIVKEVGGLTWEGSFRPRSLDDIDVASLNRVLIKLGVTADAADSN